MKFNLVLIVFGLVTFSPSHHAALWEAPKDAESETVEIRSLSSRNSEGQRLLNFRAFGQDFHLKLRATDIFSPNFQMYESEKNDNNTVQFRKIDKNEFHDGGELFKTEDNDHVSLYITSDDKIHGILSRDLRIVPIPTINGTTYRVFRIARKIISLLDFDQVKQLSDEVAVDQRDHRCNSSSEILERQQSQRGRNDPFYPEVLVVVDTYNGEGMNNNYQQIRQYVSVFWNAVQKMYDQLQNPAVKIRISKLVVLGKNDNIHPQARNTMKIDKDVALKAFREWVKNSSDRDVTSADVALLHLKLDSGGSSHVGYAHTSSACEGQGVNTAYFEDILPNYDGVHTAAHELAHTLGASHDGDVNKPLAAPCSSSDQYLMTNQFRENVKNHWIFSRCSINQINNYLSSQKGSCTWQDPTKIAVAPSALLPGNVVWSKNKQCQNINENDNYEYSVNSNEKEPCLQLWCAKKNDNSGRISSKGPPLDGTNCGWEKSCQLGQCQASNIPSLDKQCAKALNSQDYRAATKDGSVCQRLTCVNKSGAKRNGPAAAQGSSCGSLGICQNSQCVEQLPTFNEICTKRHRAGSVPHYPVDKRCGEKLTCEYKESATRSTVMTGSSRVPDYTQCDANKVCLNGQCVAH